MYFILFKFGFDLEGLQGWKADLKRQEDKWDPNAWYELYNSQ